MTVDRYHKSENAHQQPLGVADVVGCCGKPLPTTLPDKVPTKVITVVACVLIDADCRVLVAERPAGKTMAGLWEFPGGKLDIGESPEYALVRELYEELGILTCTDCLQPVTFASHAYDDFHLLMPVFACRQWRGQVTPREGQQVRWVRMNALSTLPMPPADIPLIPLLHEWLGRTHDHA